MEVKEQKALSDFDKKLWNVADKLREQLNANFVKPEGTIGNMFSKGFFP